MVRKQPKVNYSAGRQVGAGGGGRGGEGGKGGRKGGKWALCWNLLWDGQAKKAGRGRATAGNACFFFFVVGSLKDEPGRPVSE